MCTKTNKNEHHSEDYNRTQNLYILTYNVQDTIHVSLHIQRTREIWPVLKGKKWDSNPEITQRTDIESREDKKFSAKKQKLEKEPNRNYRNKKCIRNKKIHWIAQHNRSDRKKVTMNSQWNYTIWRTKRKKFQKNKHSEACIRIFKLLVFNSPEFWKKRRKGLVEKLPEEIMSFPINKRHEEFTNARSS